MSRNAGASETFPTSGIAGSVTWLLRLHPHPTPSPWQRERGLHAALRPRAVVLDTRQHQVGGVHMKAVAFMYLCDEALDQLVVEFQGATAACALQVVVVELADPLKHGVAGTEARLGDQTNAAQVAQYPIDRRFIETGTVVAERRNDLGDGHVSLHFAEDLDDSAPGRCGPKP